MKDLLNEVLSKSSASSEQPQMQQNPLICYRCGEQGHYAKNCSSKNCLCRLQRSKTESENHRIQTSSVHIGHLGRKKTQEKVTRHFFCFEMRQDISAHVSSCKICEKNKRPNRATKAMMGNMIIFY